MIIPKTTVSEEEQDVLDLENRRVSAEASLTTAAEAKKKVEADAEKIKEEIQAGKKTIDENNSEINRTNDLILEVKSALRSEKQSLEDFLKEKNVEKGNVELAIEKAKGEEFSINAEIKSLNSQHVENKIKKAHELETLEAERVAITKDIAGLDEKLSSVVAKTAQATDGLEKVTTEIKVFERTKSDFEATLTSLENSIEDQRGAIKNNSILISQQEAKKKEGEDELAMIAVNIEKEKQNLESVKVQAFTILNKQEVLDQKTAFIKSQYERAGIKWEE